MRYYGGKGKLLNFIGQAISDLQLPENPVAVDLFSGTSVVGRFFKERGFRVLANDYLYFCKCLATARVVIDAEPSFEQLPLNPIDLLNQLPGEHGFFSENYSPIGTCKRQYFTASNALKIDAIRSQIELWRVSGEISTLELEYLIASLLEAMNLTSNVSGTYAAFLKQWDSRAMNDLVLKSPLITSGPSNCESHNEDANLAVSHLHGDILYLDPPYNQRQYSSNYFLLDVVARGWFSAKPEVRGITGMRDNASYRSAFCLKDEALPRLEDLVSLTTCRYVLLSYNDEGLIEGSEIINMLNKYGSLRIFRNAHPRYRSNNHDPKKPSTVESLYLLRKD